MIDRGVNTPITSSLGRLFDGFAVLAGLGQKATYEAELAVALESAYDPGARPFDFPVRDFWDHFEVDWAVALKQGIDDPPSISGGFHKGISEAIVKGCLLARQKTGLKKVCLSGGCFLNFVLLELVFDALSSEGFEVYTNISLPPGDGCVSFGQAVVALSRVGGV
jgi:hydrogenase maturation protein HypF